MTVLGSARYDDPGVCVCGCVGVYLSAYSLLFSILVHSLLPSANCSLGVCGLALCMESVVFVACTFEIDAPADK